MKNFNRDNRSNRSGGSRGDKWPERRDFGDRRGPRPQMHQAVCSECGQECEIPFRPTGDRPVFCRTCFGKHGKTNSAGPGAKNYQRSDSDNKRMFEAVCSKCGNKCEVPFRPTGDKPVYCSQCFDKGSKFSAKTPDQFKEQFEILNSKLDKILRALNPTVSLPADREEETATAKKDKAGKASVKIVPKKIKTKKSASGGKK
ncbi:MAG: CxxC-x17-CxxC domain-containing protein [Patescibacteria group bacterium]